MQGNQKASNAWLNRNNINLIPDTSSDNSQNADQGEEMLRMVCQQIPGLSSLLLKNKIAVPDVPPAPDIVPQRSGFSVQDIIDEIPYMKESTQIKIMQQLVKTEIQTDEEAELVKDALKYLSMSTTYTGFQSVPETILNIISEITEEYEQRLVGPAPIDSQLDIDEEDEIERELYGSRNELKPGDSLIPFLNDGSSSRSGFEESNKVSDLNFNSGMRVTRVDNFNTRALPRNSSLNEERPLYNRQNKLDTNNSISFLSCLSNNNNEAMMSSSLVDQNQSQAAMAPILEYLKQRAQGSVEEYPEHSNRKDGDGMQQKCSDEPRATSQSEDHSRRSERSSRHESRYAHRSYRSSHRSSRHSERSSRRSERSSRHSDRKRERRNSVTEERYREWKRHRD